jgi:hypothetical protein
MPTLPAPVAEMAPELVTLVVPAALMPLLLDIVPELVLVTERLPSSRIPVCMEVELVQF